MPPEADAMERFGGWCNVCRGRLAGDPGGFEPPLRFEWGFIFWKSAILEWCIHLDYTHKAAQYPLFT